MEPVPFIEANCLLRGDGDEVADVRCYQGRLDDGSPVTCTCWEVTKEDIAVMLKTGRLWLFLQSHEVPAAMLTVERPEILLDDDAGDT